MRSPSVVAAISLSMLCLAPSARAQPSPCLGVTCSSHGECMVERSDAFCLCDDGFAANELTCQAVPQAPTEASGPEPRSVSIGARIVRIASGEGGRRMHDVGRDRSVYPGPLRLFLKPGELWCTDFVSWVYRAAGAPFTGGYHGGWHLTNNYAVRRWFQRNGRWVGNGTARWASFEPQPGDYLRFHTSRFGHSGIVRYVAGTTLYTVEGNSRGQVRLRRYSNFRGLRRIDGFGIVADSEHRSARASSTPDD